MPSTPSPLANVADTNVQDVVLANPMPMAFRESAVLFGTNLGMMTAFTCLGAIVVGWMLISIVVHRDVDKPLHPVTLYRWSWFCAGAAMMIRSGAAAAALWAWDPLAAKTASTVLTVQRYLDPLGLAFAGGWLLLLALTYPAMVIQLRKRPYPVEMLARLPALKKPALVVAMSIAAAALIAWLRTQAA